MHTNVVFHGQRNPSHASRVLASIAVAALAGMTLAGCTPTGSETQSDAPSSAGAQSTVSHGSVAQPSSAQSADALMSGRFIVDPETGKLRNPNAGRTFEAPEAISGMREDGAEGATKFAEHFIYVTDYAWNTGDPASIKAVSDEECSWCHDTVTQISDFANNGGWIEHLQSQVSLIGEAREVEGAPGVWGVDFTVKTQPTAFYTGDVLHDVPAKEALFHVQVRRDADSWKVVNAGWPHRE